MNTKSSCHPQRDWVFRKIQTRLSRSDQLKPALADILEQLRRFTNFEAVAIRLYEKGDYPYFVYKGFSRFFIDKESTLITCDINGKSVYCPNGCGYELDCMCGTVLSGRTDSSYPFFTPFGSFWTNSTTELLATTSSEDRQGVTRNRCNAWGYESLALIPIVCDCKSVGLMQFNDTQPGKLNSDIIECLEMLADLIGFFIHNLQLKTTLTKIKDVIQSIPICMRCKSIRIEDERWQSVEKFIKEFTQSELSHAICPNCEAELLQESESTFEEFGEAHQVCRG